MTHTTLALFNLGGGGIILILAVLLMMFLVAALIVGVILLVIQANRKTGNTPHPPAASPVPSAQPQKLLMVKCQSCGKLNDQDAKFCQECGRKL
jgi:membrane protease subunit (stomatin/prohibitin family)